MIAERLVVPAENAKKQIKSDICRIYLQLSLEYFIIAD
jgi:hypothetical protein